MARFASFFSFASVGTLFSISPSATAANVFKDWCPGDECAQTSGRVEATSAAALLPALDAKLVQEMVKQRLSQATQEIIEAKLKKEMKGWNSKPTKDVRRAMLGLLFDTAKSEARAESIALSLTRAGLTFALNDAMPVAAGCSGDQALDAVYEGIAASKTLAQMGFSEANGNVGTACKQRSEDASSLVDATSFRSQRTFRTLVDSFPGALTTLSGPSCVPAGKAGAKCRREPSADTPRGW